MLRSESSHSAWQPINKSMTLQTPAIVLIENDGVTLDLYQRELSKSFTVFGFTETKDVLTIIVNQDIRAVVIEPEIETGKGWELIHTIHCSFPERFIPIVVCSTREPGRSRMAPEVTKYLTKPVLPKTLRENIIEILKKKVENK
jgi:DNA-binding NtrC family response regulator